MCVFSREKKEQCSGFGDPEVGYLKENKGWGSGRNSKANWEHDEKGEKKDKLSNEKEKQIIVMGKKVKLQKQVFGGI